MLAGHNKYSVGQSSHKAMPLISSHSDPFIRTMSKHSMDVYIFNLH